jgi:aspartyl protease family protein
LQIPEGIRRGGGMIGWALRWVLLWCVATFLFVTAINGSPWLLSLDKIKPERATNSAAPDAPRPVPTANTLIYPADSRGHVILDAIVNGASVRFLVDTGASLVTLTANDARAAGLDPRRLAFNERATTANGEVRMAPVRLREIRLGQLAIEDVPAAVIENLKISLLGVSFLERLQSYEMRDGKLTIAW